jgi:orotate phosphoribosyltransferase
MFAERLTAQTTRLAGAELGGIPLVAATALASGLPCVFVRNSAKGHGTAKRVEGALEAGDRVTIIEDVATTGGQALEAASAITDAGAKVEGVIAAIDRQEGAREAIEAAGYAFDALFTVADLGVETEG